MFVTKVLSVKLTPSVAFANANTIPDAFTCGQLIVP